VFRKSIENLVNWGVTRLYSRCVISRIDGISIVSTRDDHADFLRVITLSFDLLRTYDPRRLQRITSATKWVVDCSVPDGARSGEFHHQQSAIVIDFVFSDDFGDDLRHAAFFAALLVHESTHGFLLDRGFNYTKELRIQTERICVAEENRFLARLDKVYPGLGESLTIKFNAEHWKEPWTRGKRDDAKMRFKRVFERR